MTLEQKLMAAAIFASIVEYVALYCALLPDVAPAPMVSAVHPMTENVDDPDVNVHPDISTLTVADVVAGVLAVPSPSWGTPQVYGTDRGWPYFPVIVVLDTVCDATMYVPVPPRPDPSAVTTVPAAMPVPDNSDPIPSCPEVTAEIVRVVPEMEPVPTKSP